MNDSSDNKSKEQPKLNPPSSHQETKPLKLGKPTGTQQEETTQTRKPIKLGGAVSPKSRLLVKSNDGSPNPTAQETKNTNKSTHSKRGSMTGIFNIGKLFRGNSDKGSTKNETKEEVNTTTKRVVLSKKTEVAGKQLLQKRTEGAENRPVTTLKKRAVLSKKLTKKTETQITQFQTNSNGKVLLRNSAHSTTSGIGESSFNFKDLDPTVKKILIVDDEISILKVLSHIFRKQGYAPLTCTSGEKALELLRQNAFDLVISDLRLGTQMDGLELLSKIHLNHPDIPVVLITGYASVKIAIQALKNGAFDLVTKPFKMDQLSEVVENALSHGGGYNIDKIVKQDLKLHFGMIVGEDEKMKNIYNLVKRISKTDATILIQGETGTETNEFAKIVHHCSRRAEAPFVQISGRLLSQSHVNPALISNTAVKANGGTLYIQDINLLGLNVQEVLLDLITTKIAKTSSGAEEVTVDIRIVVSTSIPLKEVLSSGNFSKDLYYRMCAFTLDLPPLRHRVEDIPLLLNFYCYKFGDDTGEEVAFSDQATNILLNYGWPNNVKELESIVMTSAALSKDGIINVEDIPAEIKQASGNGDKSKKSVIGQAARKYLQQQVSNKNATENISLRIRQKQ